MGLTSVTIPDSVVSIGGGAFSGCTGLTGLTIGSGVTSIGSWAFDSLFDRCDKLKSINYTGDIGGWCEINGLSTLMSGFRTLYINGHEPTGALIIPEGTAKIESSAFYGCTKLTSVTIPDGVKSIGKDAFRACTGLMSVTIPNSVTSIGSGAFIGTICYKDKSNWDSGILYIGNHLIYADNPVTNIAIKEGTITIASEAFSGCSRFMTVTIPDSVMGIGYRAFYKCTKLTSVAIPNKVTRIESEVFYGCTALTSVTIGYGVKSIGFNPFSGCTALTSITVDEDNLTYSSQDGIWYNKEKTVYIIVPDALGGVVVIPDTITSIRDEEFRGRTGLTSITIPDSVTSIGGSAFSGCTGLTSITIPNSVTSIGNWAFDGCTKLTSITVQNGNTKYHSDGNCLIETATKTLILGCKDSIIPTDGSVTSIEYGAFYNCAGLTGITIPNSVTSIGNIAFSGCAGLTSVTIGNGVSSIGSGAFTGCTGLKSINYTGTAEQWKEIEKGSRWDYNTGSYTVTCSDGTKLDKYGNVIE